MSTMIACLGMAIALGGTIGILPENPGWPVDIGYNYATPAVGDIDADGLLEVLAVGMTGQAIYAFQHGGEAIEGWPLDFGDVYSQYVALADVNRDGTLDVVTVAFGSGARMEVRDGKGALLAGWPQDMSWRARLSGPLIFDLDGDGSVELIGVTTNQTYGAPPDSFEISVFRSDGSPYPGWPRQLAGELVLQAVSVADLDWDGDLELVVGGINSWFQWGHLWVFNDDGTGFMGGPKLSEIEDGVSYGAIGLVDIAADGRPELLACAYWGHVTAYFGNGTIVPGWPAERDDLHLGMLAPISDAQGEVFRLAAMNDPGGECVVYDLKGNVVPPWPIDFGLGNRSQIVTGDLDGDPESELFLGGTQPSLYAVNLDGTVVDGWPQVGDSPNYGTGNLVDLDGDGDTEVLFGEARTGVHAYDTPGVYHYSRIDCGQYLYDAWHTGSHQKSLYREAESADEIGAGWQVRPSPGGAWGLAYLHPVDSRGAAETAKSRNSAEPIVNSRTQLIYQFEVPVWEEYSLWARVRWPKATDDQVPGLPEIVIDDEALNPLVVEQRAPRKWTWRELGQRPITHGVHRLRLEFPEPRPQIDRLLLTTESELPLLSDHPRLLGAGPRD